MPAGSHAVRFSGRPLSRSTVEQILRVARFAPSGANIQPWHVYVLAGAARAELSAALLHAYENEPNEHVSEYQYYATAFPEPYLGRRQEFGRLFYSSLGIAQSDAAARSRQTAKNYAFFGAPVGLIVTIDRRLAMGSWLDLGMFIQNVMLAAVGRGLQSCPQETFARFHRILRPLLSDPCRAIGDLRDLDGPPQGAGERSADAARGCGGVRLLQGFRGIEQEKVMGSREQLIERSIPFLREVKDMTPSAAMERWLNETYGEDSALYQDLARLIKVGVEEGWAANQEVDGPNYRRSRILEPVPETFQFSITAVYMNSTDPRRFKDEDDHDVLRGQYHGHPYGELNLVVPLNKGAQLKGLQGWQGPGWTAPDPGSRHYPEVRGGAVIALFYLPAGRISYDFKAPA
ncbi:nitroreductase [Bradyrhizobium sp. LM3.4]